MNDMKACIHMKDRLLNHQGIIRTTKFKGIVKIFEPVPNFVILIKKACSFSGCPVAGIGHFSSGS